MRYHYAPNKEPDVVLSCGCITSQWGALQILGMAGEYQQCVTHPDGEGKWGFRKILRKASFFEIYQWERHGKKAPKRRSSKAPDWMRAMSDKPDKTTSTESRRQQARLF